MEKQTDKRCRRYIRITDENMWQKIDEIMKLPEYKSFNKVINDALFYGLDSLYDSLFEVTEEAVRSTPQRKQSGADTEEYFMRIVRLLQEIILNENINKSILCSLFQAKEMELKGDLCRADRFGSGRYKDTPECFVMDELRMLKEIDG